MAGTASPAGADDSNPYRIELAIQLIRREQGKPPAIQVTVTNASRRGNAGFGKIDQTGILVFNKFLSGDNIGLKMFDGQAKQWVSAIWLAHKRFQGPAKETRLQTEEEMNDRVNLLPGKSHTVVLEPANWFRRHFTTTGQPHGHNYYSWDHPWFVAGDPVRVRWSYRGFDRKYDGEWLSPNSTSSNEVLLSREDVLAIQPWNDGPPKAAVPATKTGAGLGVPWGGITAVVGLVLVAAAVWAARWRARRAAKRPAATLPP